MIKQIRADLAAFAIAGVAIVAAVILLLAGEPVPGWFQWVAIAAITGGAGLALPGTPSTGATGLLAAGLAELRQFLDTHTHATAAPTTAAPTTSAPLQRPPQVP